MLLGNWLISFPLSRIGWHLAFRRGRHTLATFFYFCTIASVGNFIDYVPIRVFAPDGDMHSISTGFEVSPWLVLIVLGLPTTAAMIYFILRIQPQAVQWLSSSVRERTVLVLVTGAYLWLFYGAAGITEGGPAAFEMSLFSILVLFPFITGFSWYLCCRKT